MSGEGGVPARWLVVSVAVPSPEASASVVRRLLERGGRAVVEDGGRLVTHLPEPPHPAALAEELRRTLQDDLPGAAIDVRLAWQAHEDWSETWKRGLAPRRLTPRLWVTPSWCRPDAGPGEIVLVLDPGMAFGTAEHGTTRGCLRLLDGAVRPGQSVLDLGTGSGILAIAAARLGAGDVLALEGDAWALEPARENVEANGVADRVEIRAGWVGPEELAALRPRDGVVANLHPAVLERLLPGFRSAVRSGGWLIVSGILDTEWDGLARAVTEAGFRREALDADGEWRTATFRRV